MLGTAPQIGPVMQRKQIAVKFLAGDGGDRLKTPAEVVTEKRSEHPQWVGSHAGQETRKQHKIRHPNTVGPSATR